MFGGEHHQDDHHVANDSKSANHQKQQTTYHFVRDAVVRPNAQSAIELWSCCKVLHLVVSAQKKSVLGRILPRDAPNRFYARLEREISRFCGSTKSVKRSQNVHPAVPFTSTQHNVTKSCSHSAVNSLTPPPSSCA